MDICPVVTTLRLFPALGLCRVLLELVEGIVRGGVWCLGGIRRQFEAREKRQESSTCLEVYLLLRGGVCVCVSVCLPLLTLPPGTHLPPEDYSYTLEKTTAYSAGERERERQKTDRQKPTGLGVTPPPSSLTCIWPSNLQVLEPRISYRGKLKPLQNPAP